MLRINHSQKCFVRLNHTTLHKAAIMEREHLQEYIFNDPEAFFSEIGEELFLIDREIRPSDEVARRLDLLAVDREGRAVVIELKREQDKAHLAQAMGYAALVSQWDTDDFLKYLDADQISKFQGFIGNAMDRLNRAQRIILVAEGFDETVLRSAVWLSQRSSIEVTSYNISIVTDQLDNSEYLICKQVFPHSDRFNGEIPVPKNDFLGEQKTATKSFPSKNELVVKFFQQQVENGIEYHEWKYRLTFILQAQIRFQVTVRQRYGYVEQSGRFGHDEEFWKSLLHNPQSVKPIHKQKRLRFHLVAEKDFETFLQLALGQKSVEWESKDRNRPKQPQLPLDD